MEPNLHASPSPCTLVGLTPVSREAAAPQEFEITVVWEWIVSHWVPSSAANEPLRRLKLSPELLVSWV